MNRKLSGLVEDSVRIKMGLGPAVEMYQLVDVVGLACNTEYAGFPGAGYELLLLQQRWSRKLAKALIKENALSRFLHLLLDAVRDQVANTPALFKDTTAVEQRLSEARDKVAAYSAALASLPSRSVSKPMLQALSKMPAAVELRAALGMLSAELPGDGVGEGWARRYLSMVFHFFDACQQGTAVDELLEPGRIGIPLLAAHAAGALWQQLELDAQPTLKLQGPPGNPILSMDFHEIKSNVDDATEGKDQLVVAANMVEYVCVPVLQQHLGVRRRIACVKSGTVAVYRAPGQPITHEQLGTHDWKGMRVQLRFKR